MVSSVWAGQKPRSSSNVTRPTSNASAASRCCRIASTMSDTSTSSSPDGTNQPFAESITPSTVMFSVTTSFLIGLRP